MLQLQIGGWKAQTRAEPLSPYYPPAHAVRTAQQLRCIVELTRGQQLAYRRAGHPDAIDQHAVHLHHFEAKPRARLSQQLEIALTMRAEAKIVAHQYPACL